uniref:Kinesin motor domain-containing protein n=1 Tax=Macrostomum lignano TaxID=282301 RepID=A0A1I8HEJ0_9PLAT
SCNLAVKFQTSGLASADESGELESCASAVSYEKLDLFIAAAAVQSFGESCALIKLRARSRSEKAEQRIKPEQPSASPVAGTEEYNEISDLPTAAGVHVT